MRFYAPPLKLAAQYTFPRFEIQRRNLAVASHRTRMPAKCCDLRETARICLMPNHAELAGGAPMLRLLVPVLTVLLFATSVCAQESAKFDVFGGYSFAHAPSTTVSGPPLPTSIASGNLNGWNGSVEFKPFRWLGGVADFGGTYGTQQVTLGCEAIVPCPPPPFNASSHLHTALFGARLSASVGKATPFVQVLAGLAHTSLTGLSNLSDTSHAWAVGGGFDYHLVKGLAWRVQVDDLNTSFFGKTQSNFRLATGVVLRF
jgi:hypothetical protein